MIAAPTQRAILLTAAGAPAALLLGVMLPSYWTAGLGWVLFILVLMMFDALLSAPGGKVAVTASAPSSANVGEPYALLIEVGFPARALIHSARVALGVNELIDPGHPVRADLAVKAGTGRSTIMLTPARRGMAVVTELWLRWQGPLGLIAQQRRYPQGLQTLVTPNIRSVRSEGVRLFQRDQLHGLVAQLERGEGADFEALSDYQSGKDRRTIDWKQSARHTHLLAKEYRAERDNRIVFAVDCGRAMSEPLAQVPRVDRAISAALLTAWAALKLGDRVSLYAFDSQPRLHSGTLGSTAGFAQLQKLAGTIDYSTEETNHTLALSALAQQLTRRALIVFFTDFTDPTGADLMVRALGWLILRHVVLFVIMRDTDLAELMNAAPASAADVSRSVAAAALDNEQRKVIARLRRLGLDVIVTEPDRMGMQLVEAYVALKRRGRL